MKRHPSLIPLSSHHQNALVQAKSLRSRSGKRTAEERRNVAKTFLKFWESHGQSHFRVEEEVVLPTLARFGIARAEAISEMLTQHVEIRALVQEMADLIERNEAPSAERMVELGELLDRHVRLEEHTVFPYVERTVPEAELVRLRERLV